MALRVRRLAPVALAFMLGATVVVAAPACGDDSAGSGGSGAGGGTGGAADDPAIDDVVYEGGATDEALEDFLAGTVTNDPAESAAFTAPAADAVLPATTPATFTWALPQQGLWMAPSQPGLAPTAPGVGAVERAATAALGLLLAGVPEAHAHGDPVNGRAYLVVFSTAAEPTLLRVFTTSTSYTPDDAAWATLKSAGAPITATLSSAVFESNRVGADGGPFAGGAVTFTVE